MTAEDELHAAVEAILHRNHWRLQRDQAIWDLRNVYDWKVDRVVVGLVNGVTEGGIAITRQRDLGISHDHVTRISRGDRPT